jgi:hypothetical protein
MSRPIRSRSLIQSTTESQGSWRVGDLIKCMTTCLFRCQMNNSKKIEDESRSYSPIKQPNDMSKKLKFTSPDKTPGQKFGKLNPLNPGVSPGFD